MRVVGETVGTAADAVMAYLSMGNRHNDDYDNIVHCNERPAQSRRSLRRNGIAPAGVAPRIGWTNTTVRRTAR